MNNNCAEMIAVLTEVRQLLCASEESLWAALTPQQVIAILDRELTALKSGGRLKNKLELASIFAPTAEVQEISIASGWSDRYLKLSSRFDEALKSCA